MNDWHLVHLGSFAKGGAGLIIFEASGVAPEGRITPWDAGIWKDEHIAPMKRIVDFVHTHDSAACLQIAHAGRKASTFPPLLTFPRPRVAITNEEGGWNVVGPSSVEWDETHRHPHELSKEEIQGIVQQFADAARRANEAGFDAVEIHGAHGYLISSFNSPIANKRKDEYGGDFEGRTRFCREVVTAVRKVWPAEKPLWLRLSCSDWVEGEEQWDSEQTVRLAAIVAELGVDVLDCSSSGQSPNQKMKLHPGYQIPFARAVKKAVPKLQVATVGNLGSAELCEEILGNEDADFVAIGREFLRDPFWPLHAAATLQADVHWPPQYEWAVNPPRASRL